MSFDLSSLPAQLVAKGAKGENFPPEVKVGTGGTQRIGSDRYPFTVVGIARNGRQLLIKRDEFRVVSGNDMEGNTVYDITPSTGVEGASKINWAPKRKRFTDSGGYIFYSLNGRSVYRDPHF